ncbi:MAG TPA: hypothetical protein VF972_01835, partial [Actinomycetota bacterium]
VTISRRAGNRLDLAFDLVWLAFAYGRVDRNEEAVRTAVQALDLFRDVENPTGIALAFLDLAFLLTWRGRHGDAIRMAAVSEAVRRQAGGGPMPGFAGLLEGDPAAEARAHLSNEDAERAWTEGLGMTVDDAVALARQDIDA